MVRLTTGEQGCNNQSLTKRLLGWRDKRAAGSALYVVVGIEDFRLALPQGWPAAFRIFLVISISERLASVSPTLEPVP
jgi:hypothetical protein